MAVRQSFLQGVYREATEVACARTALRAVLFSSRSGSRPSNPDEFVAIGITNIGEICAVCAHSWRVLD
jgi:hypothetical protein